MSEEAGPWQSCNMEVNKDFRPDFMKVCVARTSLSLILVRLGRRDSLFEGRGLREN